MGVVGRVFKGHCNWEGKNGKGLKRGCNGWDQGGDMMRKEGGNRRKEVVGGCG